MELNICFKHAIIYSWNALCLYFYIASLYTTKILSSIMLQEVELYTISYKEWNMKKGKTKLVSAEHHALNVGAKSQQKTRSLPGLITNSLVFFLIVLILRCSHLTHCCCRGFAWNTWLFPGKIRLLSQAHMSPHGINPLWKERDWLKQEIPTD